MRAQGPEISFANATVNVCSCNRTRPTPRLDERRAHAAKPRNLTEKQPTQELCRQQAARLLALRLIVLANNGDPENVCCAGLTERDASCNHHAIAILREAFPPRDPR